jgi:hypothetical protein
MTATLAINIERKCLNGRDPNATYEVRQPLGAGGWWEADEEIIEWARLIVEAHLPDFPECSIVYLWKAKGGAPGGNATMGKCLKLTGDKQFGFNGRDYEIWLAADHVAAMQFSNFQLEALLYHELLHVAKQEDEDGNIKLGVRGHDFEGFVPEIENYGFWDQSAAAIARAVQLRLDFADSVPPQMSLSPVTIAESEYDAEGDEPPVLDDEDELPTADDLETEEPETGIVGVEQIVEAMDGAVIDVGNGVTATIHAGPRDSAIEDEGGEDVGEDVSVAGHEAEAEAVYPNEPPTVGVERKVTRHVYVDNPNKPETCLVCAAVRGEGEHGPVEQASRREPATEEEAQEQEEALASLGNRAK